MKFQDFTYERPDYEHFKESWNQALTEFRDAASQDIQTEAMNKLIALQNTFQTMGTLCSIRHSVDTRDEFYTAEQNYFDETMPLAASLINSLYKELLQSRFRAGLEEVYGKQIFRLAEMMMKSFSDEIIPELQEENKLSTQYSQLIASAQIDFDGKTLTLAQIDPYTQSPDRSVRRAAVEAKFGFFAEHEAEFDRLFDKLVHVRDRMARKLGFENYIPLGYMRLNRSDYDAHDVSAYREQVKESLVPLHTSLRERQAARLGLDRICFHDEGIHFTDGNASPQGDVSWMVEQAGKMYSELSPQTGRFFRHMVDAEVMDLLAKPGKEGGGYCTYLPDYHTPFIFSNSNGTSDDVDTLTHEAGHAFQAWLAGQSAVLPEYIFPTYEAAEIFSMGMEFFTWPWMENFFGEQTPKYKYMHLTGALLFVPYGVTVDHFQHWVYEHPEASPQDRKNMWRDLERQYLPSRSYDGIDFLERGGFWMRQGHIFGSPFYYIDYTLAQMLALQFWVKDHTQGMHEEAWESYLKMSEAGGSLSFLELVGYGGMDNPFTPGTIARTLKPVQVWLEAVDDTKL